MRYLLAAGGLVLFLPLCASAGIVVNVGSAQVPYSATQTRTGWLEVYVQSDTSPQPFLVGQQMRLHIASPAPSAATFIDFAKSSAHPYVFPSGQSWGGSISDSGATVTTGDGFVIGSDQLANGDGLSRLEFQVAAGTPASVFNVTLDTGVSFLKEDNGAAGSPLSYTVNAGTITVTPEPGTLAMLGVGGVALVLAALYRRVKIG